MLHTQLTSQWLRLVRYRGRSSNVLQARRSCSKPLSCLELDTLLSKPSWSVKSLHHPHNKQDLGERVTRGQLHHLLRLSALPEPKSAEEEREMIETLESQLQFVQAIQNIDTERVTPSAAIRDETQAAMEQEPITLDTLREDLEKEENVGFSRLLRSKDASSHATAPDLGEWNPLDSAPSTKGRYFSIRNPRAPPGE